MLLANASEITSIRADFIASASTSNPLVSSQLVKFHQASFSLQIHKNMILLALKKFRFQMQFLSWLSWMMFLSWFLSHFVLIRICCWVESIVLVRPYVHVAILMLQRYCYVCATIKMSSRREHLVCICISIHTISETLLMILSLFIAYVTFPP